MNDIKTREFLVSFELRNPPLADGRFFIVDLIDFCTILAPVLMVPRQNALVGFFDAAEFERVVVEVFVLKGNVMKKNDFYTSDIPKETLDVRNKYIEERWEQLYEVSTQASNEILKYLFYVSAGGAGAVLGFMGSSETARKLVGAKIALICYGIGLVLVGVVRVIIAHRTDFFSEKWKEDVVKYYAGKVGYNEIVDLDTKRTKSAVWEFVFGYLSAIACLLGLVFGGFALFS